MTPSILGAGFGRTGTHSLKVALERLGFGPCHHMYRIRQMPDQVRIWRDIAYGAPLDPDTALEGFASQVDWPASFFWRQTSRHFPNAKVILTDRDPDLWYDSLARTIIPGSLLGREKAPDPVNRDASDMIAKLILEGLFEGRYDDRDFVIGKFLAHRQEVIDTLPAERLLVFQTKQGWDPLCNFLGVPIPDEPFPRTNSAEEFVARKPYLHDGGNRPKSPNGSQGQ